MTTAAIRRRLAKLEDALVQITRPASVDAIRWLRWTTNSELDELERLYRDRADFDDLDDLTKLRVSEIVATATRREMTAAAAKERGDTQSPGLAAADAGNSPQA